MEEKKQLIVDAARKRFEHFGIKKTTMDEISKDAGMSKRTVYECFKNKEELFVSVFIREALANRDLLQRELSNIDDPLVKMKEMIRLSVQRHGQETFMVKVLRDEHGFYTPFLKEKYRLQVENGVLDLFSKELERGMQMGKIRPLNSHTVSYFIFKLFQTFTFAKTESIKGDSQDLNELINFIFDGIQSKKS